MQVTVSAVSALISRVINFLYPSSCPVCGSAQGTLSHSPFCMSCWQSISAYPGKSCHICAAPVASDDGRPCGSCMISRPLFVSGRSFGLYEGALAEALNILKFQGGKKLGKPLGEMLSSCHEGRDDGIVPVPLSLNRLRMRGYNQSLLLAKEVSGKTGIPLIPNGLARVRDTRPQTALSAKERKKNVRGAFRSKRSFSGMRLLLIDDVMTTGATMNECARELLNAGAQEVRVLALARVNAL